MVCFKKLKDSTNLNTKRAMAQYFAACALIMIIIDIQFKFYFDIYCTYYSGDNTSSRFFPFPSFWEDD